MSTMTVAAGGLRVAQLAAAVGISPDAVRFYEREGLLPPPARTSAGYRSYGADAVERLRFIQGCQRLGLRLREIGDLLAIRDTGTCPVRPCGGAATPPYRRGGCRDGPSDRATRRDDGDGRRPAVGDVSTAEPRRVVSPRRERRPQ